MSISTKQKRVFGVMRTLSDLMRAHGAQVGHAHEESVFRACSTLRDAVPWFKGITKASEEEDWFEGKDFTVDTDVGKIFLQVKSSERRAEEFRRKQSKRRYNRYIAVVVINQDCDDARIRSIVLGAIGQVRDIILSRRGGK